MQLSAFVAKGNDGTPFMGIQIMDGQVGIQINLGDDNYIDDAIKQIIAGLKEARADLRRQASGLVVANGMEVPDGFRRIQGRPAQRTGGKG